jgi:hypothetical protein
LLEKFAHHLVFRSFYLPKNQYTAVKENFIYILGSYQNFRKFNKVVDS